MGIGEFDDSEPSLSLACVPAAYANCQNSDHPLGSLGSLGSLREKKLALTKDFTQRAPVIFTIGAAFLCAVREVSYLFVKALFYLSQSIIYLAKILL